MAEAADTTTPARPPASPPTQQREARDDASRAISQAIPVALNEAALDSPTFRATTAHVAEQVDTIEKWLHGYVASTSKLTHDMLALEDTVNAYISKTVPSAADGVIDNDYTFLALTRVGDSTREYWTSLLVAMKRMETVVLEPVRTFLTNDMKNFKDVRRNLEQTQRTYDSALARYVGQSKTKEPSALREDAFSVYENRKAYIQSSMDYCQLAPQLRFTMEKLLVKVSTELWRELKRTREMALSATKHSQEMDRVRGWAKEMELSEGVFRRELQLARRDVGEATFEQFRPSRELEDYSTSTVPFLGSRGPVHMEPKDEKAVISEKQGWLFLRIVTGKPVRHTWVRRWYYCRGGVFGWLIPGPIGVLQGDDIGVLLCNARPAPGEDRRFCFEIKTKSQTLMLQCETQRELTEWLEVFEVTKKKAFEASMNQDKGADKNAINPAFAISPPILPEFSAKALDAQLGLAVEDPSATAERAGGLQVPNQDGGAASRQSFDINGSVSRRSLTALGRDLAREEGESGREHAARIIQKLDLHRKATFGAGAEAAIASSSGSAGGIASLISASHNLLPAYQASPALANKSNSLLPPSDSNAGTLAPLTLARPPSITLLSRTAVLSAVDQGVFASGTRLPTSVMANYWGSNVWATISAPDQPTLPRIDEGDPVGVVVAGSDKTTLGQGAQKKQLIDSLPANYPPELRAQYAQFRILFPNVGVDEQLVLVFRAAWTSSSERDGTTQPMNGDGRIYVTSDNMYFFGNQMGLVTAYCIRLDIITEVAAASGRDCDFIFLHLRENTNDTGFSKITVKVFLDEIGLLHARLNLLVDNLQAEEPMGTRALISALLNIEKEEYDRPSPGVEGWEEVSPNTPVDAGTLTGRLPSRSSGMGSARRLQASSSRSRHHQKLHLPSHPVVYEPDDMPGGVAAGRSFEISAKACFHLLFGDKSFVFPKLYFERRAQQIAQGPWALMDQGRMRREYQFDVDQVDMLGRSKTVTVNDYQVIDVFNEHATYVVTHSKTAWHLPHSQLFRVTAKFVITHVAKSKCKLAAYVRVDWSKTPALSKGLVERQALRDAASDAEGLAELATDQVRKLGARSRTNRAIQVYGQVGQQTQVVVFSPGTSSGDGSKKGAVKPRTLTAMVFETLRSFGESAVSSLIMWAIAGCGRLFKVVSVHRVLLLLLALSVVGNMAVTSNETSTWWRERRAAMFMHNMGIGPNAVMSKAVYLTDLMEAAEPTTKFPGTDSSNGSNSTCFASFRGVLDATDMDAPWSEAGSALTAPATRSTARRLRRTRQRMGSYRHDLVVAMRVVNSIEREVVQSEWENWLANEASLCENLELVLREEAHKKDGSKKEGAKKKGAKGKKHKREAETETEVETLERLVQLKAPSFKGDPAALGPWMEEYCGSCIADRGEVARTRLAGILRRL